jgi:glutaryl-CoA dehydrogenase
MRASVTSSLSFSACRIPDNMWLPGAVGLKAALARLSHTLYGIGWGVLGPAVERLEDARQDSIERKQCDNRPIASHQLVQEKLAWTAAEAAKARVLAPQCSRLKNQGKLAFAHISTVKRNNVAISLECARLARGLPGANGIVGDRPVMRHHCNLETVNACEGTDHIHALVIGKRLTGIAACK